MELGNAFDQMLVEKSADREWPQLKVYEQELYHKTCHARMRFVRCVAFPRCIGKHLFSRHVYSVLMKPTCLQPDMVMCGCEA